MYALYWYDVSLNGPKMGGRHRRVSRCAVLYHNVLHYAVFSRHVLCSVVLRRTG